MSRVGEVFGSLSVVIPAYNAAGVIGRTLRESREYLGGAGVRFEIIVVDDGSRDATAARAAAAGDEVRVIRFERNRGKGAAVRAGLLEGHFEWVMFMDADHSTSIEHLERFAERVASKGAGSRAEAADILIGSRRLAESRIVVEQPRFRQALGRTFPYLVRMVALPDFQDTQCGFKVFRREAARAVASRLTIERFAFDVELLSIAQGLGLRVEEVPVDWANPPASTLRIGWDAPRMLWDVLRVAYRTMRGAYGE